MQRPWSYKAWVSDIIYIRIRGGWLHLAAVVGLHSRKIAGRTMAAQMPASLVCAARQIVIAHRNRVPGLVVHSERSEQYASGLHPEGLAKCGLRRSVLRKGNSPHSALMERVWQKNYAPQAQAGADLADYIDNF